MICLGSGNCNQGRRECSTPVQCGWSPLEVESAARVSRAMNAPIRRIEFAGDEPEEFTQGEALEKLTMCESALYFAIGAAAVAAVAFIAWQLLPVAVSYWR